MGRKNNDLLLGITLVLVVLLGANALGYINLKPGTGVPTPTPGGALAIANGTGACDGNPPVITGLAYYLDTTNANIKTSANTGFYLFKKGSAVPLLASTATPNSTSQGMLSCGDKLVVVYGDATENVTGYYRTCEDLNVDKESIILEKQVKAYGAPVFYVSNASTSYTTLAEINNESIGSGGVNSSITGKVVAPSGASQIYGNYGWALCSRFSSTEFARVMPAGSTQVSVGHIKTTSTKDTIQCFEMSSYGLLENSRQVTFPIIIQASAGHVPANSSTIDYILVDKTVSMYGSECIIGYDRASDVSLGTGGADIVNVNYTRVHSDD